MSPEMGKFGWLSATQRVCDEVHDERVRQDKLHGEANIIYKGPEYGLIVLQEEIGEAAKELLESHFASHPTTKKIHRENLRTELVQVAAVAVAMVEAIDREGA